MGLGRKVRAWMSIIRIGNAASIGLAAIVGYWVAGGSSIATALKLFFSAMLIGGAGNVINDYADREVDAINKPWRPIPSGAISPREALIGFFILNGAGLAIAALLPWTCLLVAVLASIALALYSLRLKKILLVGNNVVALMSAINLVYGGLAAPKPLLSMFPAIYAYLLILGREFLKGLEDVEGDRRFGIKTLATEFGRRWAYVASWIVMGVLIAISPLPYILAHFNLLYIVLATLGTDATIVIALIAARKLDEKSAWKATRIMKLSFVFGLLAFLVGAPRIAIWG